MNAGGPTSNEGHTPKIEFCRGRPMSALLRFNTPILNLFVTQKRRKITIIMAIKRIEIKNFKSFSDQKIELGQFNTKNTKLQN
jgi:hypothetical protein